jgi:Mrp family chromosome partitioning ATPase
MMGIVFGIFMGITTAMLTEHLDTSIGRVDDIESFIKVNVVGVIPYCTEQHSEEKKREKKRRWLFFKRSQKEKPLEPRYILEMERKSEVTSLFLEAFRLLGVNIQVLFGKGGRIKNKVIMLTSCKPEEGKTVITSTLGMVMAQMGYRVLLIDADVRRAHIHKTFGLKDKENGLTDILTGKINADAGIRTATDIMLGVTSIDKVVEKPWLNNLNILTAGSTFPNTINLFNSSKMDETLDYFKNKYEIVLMDTSPVLAVSEPSILLPKVDGVLLVYRAGSTSRLALRRAKIQIEGIRGKGSLSGVILNNVTPEIGMDTYYYYSKKYYHSEDKESVNKKEGNNKNV